LSFRSSLALIAALADLAQSGSQIIRATQSPMLTALPAAQILELPDDGIISRDWENSNQQRTGAISWIRQTRIFATS
jgi:predicted ATPase